MTSEPRETSRLRAAIEHTLLRATATPQDVEALCAEARLHGFAAVCVNSLHAPAAAAALAGSGVRLATVAAFPLGASSAADTAAEVEHARRVGAQEVDVVAPLGWVAAAAWSEVARWLADVRRAASGMVLKVILETGYFEPARLEPLAELVVDSGADYLKTSTGFGPRGASLEDVRLLAAVARGRAAVKASGGIRTRELALELLGAGASRLGTSSGVALLGDRASG